MKFSYHDLNQHFTKQLPLVEVVAEALTMHSSEVEELVAKGDDWEMDVKILPDRAVEIKTSLALARELSAILELPLKDGLAPLPTAETARAKIIFSADDINHLLGVALGEHEITDYLKRVRVVVNELPDHRLEALIPAERLDLNIREDLADEVARLYGYENIVARVPTVSGVVVKHNQDFILANKLRVKLVAEGYTEIYGYTFVSHGELTLEKPLASDKAWLRTNLKEGMEKSVEFNLGRVLFDKDEIKLFEIGNVFVGGGEEIRVAVGCGVKKPKFKIEVIEKKLSDFVEELVDASSNLDGLINKDVHYKPVSIYPRIIRDIALFVPEGTDKAQIVETIKAAAGGLLVEGPVMFDEFHKEGKISYAFRLVFQSHDRTLSDDELNPIMAQVIAKLEDNSGWQVRK